MSAPVANQRWTMVLLLATILLAAITEQAPSPPPITIKPGCLAECAGKSIPYPFGTGTGCFLPGFEVTCNHTFSPPRLFLGSPLGTGGAHKYIKKGSYSFDGVNKTTNSSSFDVTAMEIMDISVSRAAEVRLYAAVTTDCRIYGPYHSVIQATTVAPDNGHFLISSSRNVLIGVGTNADARLSTSYSSTVGFVEASCTSRSSRQKLPTTYEGGTCSGEGCCEASIPLEQEGTSLTAIADQKRAYWQLTDDNCSLVMMVEKGWYNYTLEDLHGDEAYFSQKFQRGVPQVLTFTVGNGSCPPPGQLPPPEGYACLRGNSSCITPTNKPGYFCKCLDYYDGNPYIPGGCQDIDECALREKYPDLQAKYRCSSGGVCKNRLRGYDCPCKPGMKGDGKTGTCTEKFPLPAKVAVGVVGGISITVVLVLFVLFMSAKKRMSERYIRNGGPLLEKINNIKIFKEDELKRFTNNYNETLGSGAFGVVYKGFLDDKPIAVKKSKHTDSARKDQFANEVIIQSRVIHKNIVSLIGCCLEVNVPVLVYEFIANGNLEDILHGKSKVHLTMDQRIVIAAESAEGLAYMHSKTSTNIQHGDVKPANILLDDNYIPKISDFGISRLIARANDQVSDQVIGDNNYMDPVYRETGLLTNKSDVYSFGLVLYELITGNKAYGGNNCSLVINHLESYTNKNTTNVASTVQLKQDEDSELLQSLAEIARECLYSDVNQRPEMTDVAERLQILRKWYATKSPSP